MHKGKLNQENENEEQMENNLIKENYEGCAARWPLRRLNLPTSSRKKRVVKEKTQQLFV